MTPVIPCTVQCAHIAELIYVDLHLEKFNVVTKPPNRHKWEGTPVNASSSTMASPRTLSLAPTLARPAINRYYFVNRRGAPPVIADHPAPRAPVHRYTPTGVHCRCIIRLPAYVIAHVT